jgi:hypothetical protein
MPTEPLPPDPDSLARWKQLPQNVPSKDALPPMTGGTRWVWWMLIILGVVILFVLLQGRG